MYYFKISPDKTVLVLSLVTASPNISKSNLHKRIYNPEFTIPNLQSPGLSLLNKFLRSITSLGYEIIDSQKYNFYKVNHFLRMIM